ncbi:AbrB/MazE/SpoVT family DNA-binding domain-containing protein [Oscillospiraceae bacterium HV4-5-C5C]|nr:AbrB/MazE/SpoVT family DNA-binding domain-containing protein [Oscillospiraceae bacterium HV4-5-C5C]
MKHRKGPAGKYAWTVKIGEKGQFVIPKEARALFDIHPGDNLLLLGDLEQGLAIPPKSLLNQLMSRIFGDPAPETDEEC